MSLHTARPSRLALVLFVVGFVLLVGGYAIGKELAAGDSIGAVVG